MQKLKIMTYHVFNNENDDVFNESTAAFSDTAFEFTISCYNDRG